MKFRYIAMGIVLFSLTFSPTLVHAYEYETGSCVAQNKARDISFLTPEEPVEEPKEVTYINYWVRQDLNIRDKPSMDGERIGVITAGESISAISIEDSRDIPEGWMSVKWNESLGYVASKYLSDTEYLPIPEADSYQAHRIHVMGKTFYYMNGGKEFGQSIIDADAQMISTWGGAATWSGDDGFNTHFIAHSSGAFNGLWHVNPGEKILVTDKDSKGTVYVITDKFIVDDYGYKGEVNLFDFIAGKGEKEVITLQTCETEETNWIIRAEKLE